MSFWYLATPYSRYHAGLPAAYQCACEQAALLVRAGVPVFSPIAHTHPISEYGFIDPLDHGVWLAADAPMIDAACGLIVCEMRGWRESKGVGHEIEAFERASKPIVYMTPGVVPILPDPKPANETCLQEAQRLVYGDRGKAYGHPYNDYKRTVEAFNALTGATLTPSEGVLFMLCVKLSRAQHSPERRDHYVDLCGYAECLHRVQQRESE